MSLSGFDYKLTWDKDFPQENRLAKRPDNKGNVDAGTHPAWKHSIPEFERKGQLVVIKTVDVTLYLVRKDNWVVKDKMVDELLKHEQGHYDLTALLARDYYKAMKKTSAASVEEMNKKLRSLDERYQQKYDNLHRERYDKQTEHGAKKSAQETWNKSIAAEKLKMDGSIDNLP